MRSTSLRRTGSVNSIRRMVLDSSTRARRACQRPWRYRRFSRFGMASSVSCVSRERVCASATASICCSRWRARLVTRSSVKSFSCSTTRSRTLWSPACNCSPSCTMSSATAGARDMARMIDRLPCSMRLAISTSPSRVSNGTVPISRRYMRTGSFVLSAVLGPVRSGSESSLPSLERSSALRSLYFSSDSTTSMPAAWNVLNRSSSSSDEVTSAGRHSLISSKRRKPFSLPTRISWRISSERSSMGGFACRGLHATLGVRHGPDCIWRWPIVRIGPRRALAGGLAACGSGHVSSAFMN